MEGLEQRLRVFTESGLVPKIPTRWQRFLGMVEMTAYVVSPDPTDAVRYAGAPLGNAILRQPIQIGNIGWDQLRIGNGLGSSLEGLCRHLLLVFHEGLPAYDLQLIQTHPDGLAHLRGLFEEVEAAESGKGRRLRRAADLVIPKGSAYRRRFLDPGGFIDRAAALDYPPARGEVRTDFQDLVSYLNYCASRLPAERSERTLREWPGILWDLATRCARYGHAPLPAHLGGPTAP